MHNAGLRNGLYLGAALVALSYFMYLFDPKFMIGAGGLTNFLVYILFIVKAGREERDSLGGYATFGEMLKPTYLAFVVGSLISTIFAFILFKYIDPTLLEVSKEISLESMDQMEQLFGEEGTEEMREQLEADDGIMTVAKSFQGYVLMLIGGGILTMIISAILKKRDPEDGIRQNDPNRA